VTTWALRRALREALGYDEAVANVDRSRRCPATEIMALALREIGIDVRTLGLYRLPAHGRVVIVPNHPRASPTASPCGRPCAGSGPTSTSSPTATRSAWRRASPT
jgi:hypothetical protein